MGEEQASTQTLELVWKPLTVGATTVKNRIVDPAKTLLYGEDHIVSDRHIAFWRERAKGGVGLIITEQTGATRVAKGSFYQGITAWEERSIPQMEKVAEAVHEFDCPLFPQLYTPGIHDRGAMVMDEWHPLWAASRLPSSVHHEIPMVMEREHIDLLVKDFGQTALNVKRSGLDGVELHAAHSYGVSQFLSPYYNKRTDRYGGSVENRCRLAIEIGREMRERTGSDFTIGIRLNFDDYLGEAGITQDDAAEQVAIFAETGLFDFFNIAGSAYPTLHYGTASMRIPHGHMVPFGKRTKEIVGDRAAVFIVGRIKDLFMAERVLTDGAADMVCMSRAHLADAFIVKKSQEGRFEEINKCIGLNDCIGRLFEHREVICALNPATGRERQWGEGTLIPVAPDEKKKVVVVGGGMAGMKVASVAARRGHDVTLLEKEEELGGHIRLLKRLPLREEWEDAIDNLRRAMASAGVEVRTGVEATKDVIDREEPDVVLVATGSSWERTGFSPHDPSRLKMPGADQDNVMDLGTALARALDDPSSLGEKVVIAEESGLNLPLGLAELLGQAGVDVEVVSPHLFIGEETLKALEMAMVIPALKQLGVKLGAQQKVESIDGETVIVADIWSSETRAIEEVDTLVLSLLRAPNDALYREIRGRFPDVRRIGDAVAPRRVADVMYEAESVGRSL